MEKQTILLVEDNPDDVELTLRVLKTHNLANEVLVARDGVEALEMLLKRGRTLAFRALNLHREHALEER